MSMRRTAKWVLLQSLLRQNWLWYLILVGNIFLDFLVFRNGGIQTFRCSPKVLTRNRCLAVFVHCLHAWYGYVEFVFSFSKSIFLLEFWRVLKLWECFSIERAFRMKWTAFIFKIHFENRIWQCFFNVALGKEIFCDFGASKIKIAFVRQQNFDDSFKIQNEKVFS